MYKLIQSDSFFPDSEPTITILHPENVSELIKVAADKRISEFVTGLVPESGKMYLHINAMGAGEFWGCNKNGDFFPEANLLEYYQTFVTSPAHVFRHHINKDPARAIGKVLYAIYNERMHRVELIAEVSKELGNDIENRIASGEYPSTSMACKTPYDACSICGNKAHTRQEYCTHLRTQLGKLLPNGQRIMALNVGPLKFFDISIVIKPADVTSSVLQKVAYVEDVVSSAELAELEKISEDNIKLASFKKFSELIKTIEGGQVDKASPYLDKILAKTQDPPWSLINTIRDVPLDKILVGFAELGINPSVKFLAELISRKEFGKEGIGVGDIVNRLVNHVGVNHLDLPKVEFPDELEASPQLIKILMPHIENCSLFPSYVEKRASGAGYAFNGPTIEPSEREKHEAAKALEGHEAEDTLRKLLGIGGIALLAKWYITSLIDKKTSQRQIPQHQDNSVKIILVKKASDYNVVKQLSKASMEKAIVIIEPHQYREGSKEGKKLVTLPTANDLAIKGLSNMGGGGKSVGNVLKTISFVSKLKEEKK